MSKLKVDVEVNTTKVASGLNASTQAAKKWASDLKGTIAGAFGGAAVAAAISKTIGSIDNMGDAGDRMGRTIQEVQLLAQMAQLAGRELGNVELMLNNIAEAQVDALGGNEAKMATFRAAGFNEQSLSQTNELGVLQQMAKAFGGKSIPEMRGMGVSDIVGKKGMGTFAALQGDLAGFSDSLKAASANLLDPKTMAEFKMNMDLVSLGFKQLTTTLANEFLPIVNGLIGGLDSLWTAIEGFSRGIMGFMGGLAGTRSTSLNPIEIWKKFKEALSNAAAGWTAGYDEAADKNISRKALRGELSERLRQQEELSKMGPGKVPKKDADTGTAPDKPVWHKMAVPDQTQWKNPGLSAVGRGGFTGVNLGLLGAISRETTSLLKQIEKNTRAREFANGHNAIMEIMGKIFGVTVV